MQKSKIYFASDFHLGYPDAVKSREREKKIVRWIEEISKDASELYLLGDIFDFWYEYKWVIPRGNIRFLGALSKLADSGTKLSIFTGNHDTWIKDYLPSEIPLCIYRDPLIKEFSGKKFYLHHGHALGNYDLGMNLLNKIFNNKKLQWMFSRIHPNGAFYFAHKWSEHNRKAKEYESDNFLGEDKEWLIKYSKEILKKEKIDYFVFGHRHFPLELSLNDNSKYINTGNWITRSTYAVFDGENLNLKEFEK